MPLGNLTSQFFANLYLNELDYFVKHELKAKYYIRYVDDFVILHSSKLQLEIWKNQINNFLKEKLKLSLHPDKSKIIPLSRGIDFVGFRNFYYFKLLRKRNIRKMLRKAEFFKNKYLDYQELMKSYQGWQAYAKWANTFKLRRNVLRIIYKELKQKMPNNKSKGSRVERELLDIFTKNSWRSVRVAGSGVNDDSPCDLIAAKTGRKGFTIEVKSSKKSTVYIKKEQIEDFMLFSNIIGLKPVIALRFNHEGWLFLDPKHLKDTGKYWAASIENAKQNGFRFSEFFEKF